MQNFWLNPIKYRPHCDILYAHENMQIYLLGNISQVTFRKERFYVSQEIKLFDIY